MIVKRLAWAASVIVLLAGFNSARASLIYWSPQSGGNGDSYGITPSGSWTAAEAFAESQGGHLVTIDSAATSAFIQANFLTGAGATQDYWIGLHSTSGDPKDPSSYVWASGSTSTFQNWRPGQPHVGSGNDRGVAINSPRRTGSADVG